MENELNDLSVELDLLIFDYLNLIELLNVSATNDYYRELGADVFRRKYGPKSIDFLPSFK